MWTQVLGSQFGFAMPGCGGTGNSVMLAAHGATVATIAAQVSAYTGTMDSKTLVTVMGGLHDVLSAYQAYKAGTSRADALTQAADAGRVLGQLINSLARNGAGGRVIYATMPDLGLSPYAIAEAQQTLLSDLSAKFNEQLRLAVVNDGRYVGLVTSEANLQAMVNAYNANTSSNGYGLTNVTDWACSAAATKDDWTSVLGCTNLTLVSTALASSTTYLWADAIHPGPNWQRQVGSAAVTRATNNPF
jgi:phospholipase/lecithinase/hemolysin